jgi:heptosyltransferase III
LKSVLVIATRQIGDVLLTTPLIRAARERWPSARIEVLGFAGTLGMLRGSADIDALIETPARLGWRGFWRLLRSQWRRHELALVTQPSDRAHLLGWMAARRRAGLLPAKGGSNWWKRLLLDHAVTIAEDLGEVHVVAEKLRLLDPWRGHGEASAPRVQPPPAKPLPADVEAQLRPGAVVMHVPSMWPYKQWPLAHYREVAQALLAAGHQVLLTGAAGDREAVNALADLAGPPALLDLAGRLDFGQLTTLLARAALYIGPDTSVSHLAAAAGIPVVAVFGPTNPMRWGPWPAQPVTMVPFVRSARVQQAGNVTLVQGTQACVPCGRAGCEDHRQSRSDCLQSIPASLVQTLAFERLRSAENRAAQKA